MGTLAARGHHLIEDVQRRMVRQVTGLQGRTYEERLGELKMVTLERRRRAEDLAQAHNILHGGDDVDSRTWFERPDQNRNSRMGTATERPPSQAGVTKERTFSASKL